MMRRFAAAACGTVAMAVLVVVGARGAQADDGDAARALLDRAHEAAADQEFDGSVMVEWTDGDHRLERTISVEARDGLLNLGDDRLVSAGTRRLLRTESGWRLLWTGAPKGSDPNPSRKYRFTVKDDASVADRAATKVTIRRSGSDDVRERMFFDDATGMLLRRDQVDSDGKLVRRFAFVELSDPEPVKRATPTSVPKVSGQSVAAPHTMQETPDDLRAPKKVGDGYTLAGIYSQPDGSVQLYYGDGLLGVSVFERAGKLDWDSLPEGGSTFEVAGERTRLYRTAAGVAVVWGSRDVTYTCVTDAPLSDVAAIVADVSGGDESSTLDDIGRFVTAPFTWG
jgi:negative regulator of sigma E activity